MHSLKTYLAVLSALGALWLIVGGIVNIGVLLELGALVLILKAIYRREDFAVGLRIGGFFSAWKSKN